MSMKFDVFIIGLTLLLCVVIKVNCQRKIVCYHTNWSQYRQGDGKFMPENIDAQLCTHIIYSFAKISGNSLDAYEWNDKDTMYPRTIALKKQNPSLKILLAVGGWNHGSAPFTQMVSNPTSRKQFVDQSIQYLKQYGFDGLDLDWEYPSGQDKQLFTALVQELKQAYVPNGLLLTAAVAAGQSTVDGGYEIDKIARNLDWINLMSYDLHGQWESFLGFNAPLYARSSESSPQNQLNVAWAVNYWHSKGAPKDKLVLGMGTYGRSFRLSSSGSNKPGDGAGGGAPAGTFTGETGFLSYYEVCQKMSQGWTRVYHQEHRVPYAYSSSEWVGYDDVQSLKEKVDFIKQQGLGGAMFWALDLDDFSGKFCNQGKYPLINLVKEQLNKESGGVLVPTMSPSITTTSSNVVALSTSAASTLAPSVICVNGDGYYQDLASSCTKYYRCVYSGTPYQKAILLSCPSGFSFDMKAKNCAASNTVQCAGIATTTIKTTTSSPLSFTPSGLCKNGDGYYPDVSSGCIKYYRCIYSGLSYENVIFLTCPSGFRFDSISFTCKESSLVQCGSMPLPTITTASVATTPVSTTRGPLGAITVDQCKTLGDGYHVDVQSSCTKYYLCLFSNSTAPKFYSFTCPSGQKFDLEKKGCSTTAACGTSLQATTQVTTTTSLYHIQNQCKSGPGYYSNYASDCTAYYLCAIVNGSLRLFNFQCASGLKFDDTIRACSDLAKCIPPATIQTPQIEPVAVTQPTYATSCKDILTPNKNNGCQSYFQCDDSGGTKEHFCPGGTLFDASLNVCNWAANVLC